VVGTNRKVAETVRGALKDAGSMLMAVAVIASLALGLAAGAFYVAFRALRAVRPA
jgi:hypothetical protein